jgi:hypothetical protein
MAQYRVKALVYVFESELEQDHFQTAEPLSGSLGDFTFTLADGILRAEPSSEYRDRELARDALEPHLRSWGQRAFLRGSHRIRFRYDRSEVDEVDPTPGSVTVFPETITVTASVSAGATISRDNRQYPAPPSDFRRTDLGDRIVERVRRVRDREAEVPAAAYRVLTEIEDAFGGSASGSKRREAAAYALGVEPAVLRKLGELTARNDPEVGRKAGGPIAPLSAQELTWMRAVIEALALRVGQEAAGSALAPLRMADLPSLP